ncbi:poly(R)-hydroxyalkanoic acid synthase subunit PhaE [Leptolyngbya sp. 7M]|uniref:poly(R)-hydroxyalkanoic acid synthase subunit PhaE n=1 Tax=Leptolyngbya sp. 7M TaxID=2812896 RepID=UPI001B8BEA69|nr:poly(R)-hydroxyalkanoic acid synthase subunit PhaE [Leptolyngbya sp. 7M]QYO67153.1 hypothetical protein JVX88_10310 [Leptolyngbya sp. 7M]
MEEANFSEGIVKPWIELNNLCWNFVYETTFSTFAQIPFLGLNRDFNHQLMQVIDAWVRLYPTSINYQLVLTEIQLTAFEELLRELTASAMKGEPIRDWTQLQQLWSSIADRVFEKTFCSEINLKIRGQFLNNLNHFQRSQQQILERWMKLMHLPSRSEIDEVHKNIYDLRKEVKRLKQALAQHEELSSTYAPHLSNPL